MRSYSELKKVMSEGGDVPFDGPYKKKPGTVTDKSGAKHTPMSRVRHLAKMAAKKKEMKESEDDQREYNYEGEMAKTKLRTICRHADELEKMLGDDQNLPEWVQSKITKAEDYLSTAHNYMMSDEGVTEAAKMECPKCKGEGCEHCEGKGYHAEELTPEQKAKRLEMIKKSAQKLNKRAERDAKKAMKNDPVLGKRPVDEEVEELDELSKKTLGSYVKKASNDSAAKAYSSASAAKDNNPEKGGKDFVKSRQRQKGIEKATDRLTKEALSPKQKKIDRNKNGKIDGADLAKLRKEEVDEAVGTAAKHAGKTGLMGGKYTSSDHAVKMKNFSQWRDKKQKQRDAEHKKQDPKMQKMGYAKHMTDTQKAAKKAAKKGADPSKTARSTYHQKNGITPNRKLPEDTDPVQWPSQPIEERNAANALKRKTMDAARGARYKLNNPVPDSDHKTAQAKNKAIGRALRNEGDMTSADKKVVNVKEPDGKIVPKKIRARKVSDKEAERMEEKVKQPTGDLKDACWKGYTAVGTKKKNGKTVPNCVPEETMTAAEKDKAEDIVKGMKKNLQGFKDRYGKRAKDVMYATANKLAQKNEGTSPEQQAAIAIAKKEKMKKESAGKQVNGIRFRNEVNPK